MSEREHTEPIRLYLDDDTQPFKVSAPPLTFQFNTIALPDGPHKLRIEAPNGLAPPTLKEIPFVVRNGVAISASGLEANQTIAGQVQMVINAYAGSTEVDFEPRRAETPQPIPTWAWVVLLAVVAWTMYYLLTPQIRSSAATETAIRPSLHMGERIFADACARCHGEEAEGRKPKIPMLRDAAIALEDSPAELLIRVTSSTPGIHDARVGDAPHERGTRLGRQLRSRELGPRREPDRAESPQSARRHRRAPCQSRAGPEAARPRRRAPLLRRDDADPPADLPHRRRRPTRPGGRSHGLGELLRRSQ